MKFKGFWIDLLQVIKMKILFKLKNKDITS